MKKFAIFDLDGTLMDTIEDLNFAMNEMLREMKYPEITRVNSCGCPFRIRPRTKRRWTSACGFTEGYTIGRARNAPRSLRGFCPLWTI